MLTASKLRQGVLNLTLMAESLGNVTNALPGLCGMTGCDTTGAFSGKGETSALKLVTYYPEFCSALSELGTSLVLAGDSLMYKLENFVCALYSSRTSDSVNGVRHPLFCTHVTDSRWLPPSKNA